MKVLWKITAWLYRTSLLPYCNLESWHFDSISWSPIKPASALMLLLPLTISKVKSHGKLWCGWENTCINVFINGVWRWSSSVVSDSLGSHDAYQASPSMGFSRQEYWSGVPSPSLIYRAVSPKFTSSIQLLKSKTIISSCLFDTFIGRSHRLFNSICPQVNRASLTAQLVKNPPAGQETSVQFLGWEDPLEKG